jgi:SAM-dependent methyltransferase
LKRYSDIENKKILDFGSGVGAISNMFEPQNYLGIDSDTRRVHYARKLNPNYAFEVSKGNKLPVLDDSFDSIIIVAVLHHIPSEILTDYLEEFKRVLRLNGTVLVIEPCLFNNSYINNWFMGYFDKGEYIRTEDEYMNLFHDHGFKINLLSRYRKIFYNEIFFAAVPILN